MKGGLTLISKSILVAAIFCSLALAPVSETRTAPNSRNANGRWVGTWASSPQLGDPGNAPPAPGLAGSTLRQIIHVSLGGNRIRVRFSNTFGASPLVISSAHVALSAGGSKIRPETDKALAFHGQPLVTIPAGALMYSDALEFDLAPLSDLSVTIHLEKVPEGITTHPGSRETSYLEAGDSVSAPEMPTAAEIDHWYFLNGVDVFPQSEAATVVVLGDSITDGKNSTTNGNGRWPDDLARRLQTQKNTKDVGVLNEGIGGNRLLHDGLGPNALARLDRDVLAQSGVRWLIVLEGINDLGVRPHAKMRGEEAPTAEDLIAAYEQIIYRAHAHGIRVYAATIMPCGGSFYSNSALETDRQAINHWIRTGGQFDAVIDFDAATWDAGDHSRLSPKIDSGDHLHPSNSGYQTMANSIALSLFAK